MRNSKLRKHIIKATEPNLPRTSEEWLNLEEIARVEVSSEDPQRPIESAFKRGESLGWRASQPGEQTIRRFGSYLMSQKTFDGYGSVFRSHKLSERSSSRSTGQIANQVLSERSLDSNGTLIPEQQ
jgi:hypothetical protein